MTDWQLGYSHGYGFINLPYLNIRQEMPKNVDYCDGWKAGAEDCTEHFRNGGLRPTIRNK